MRKLLVLGALAALTLVAGCNTVEGVGRDVTAAGRAVSEASRDAR
jgi:predicted small secreted protein